MKTCKYKSFEHDEITNKRQAIISRFSLLGLDFIEVAGGIVINGCMLQRHYTADMFIRKVKTTNMSAERILDYIEKNYNQKCS